MKCHLTAIALVWYTPHMNGKGTWNLIADLLVTQNEALKRETIAREIGKSEFTVRDYLTKMKRAGLVNEVVGFWTATPELKTLREENEFWGAEHFEATVEPRREIWAELLKRKAVQESTMVSGAVHYNDFKENLKFISDELDILVTIWLVKEGLLTEFERVKTEEHPAIDDLVQETLVFMANKKDYKEKA